MFISEVAAPTALQMALTTREYGDSQRPNETAYNVAFKNSPPFAAMCEQRTKLRRQSGAFSRLGKHDEDRQVVDLLGSLRFATIGGATVVDVCLPFSTFITRTNIEDGTGRRPISVNSLGSSRYLSKPSVYRPDMQ